MAGKPQTYTQNPTTMWTGGVSPFAAVYSQPNYYDPYAGTKSTGGDYARGGTGTHRGWETEPEPIDPVTGAPVRGPGGGRAVPNPPPPPPRGGAGGRATPDPFVPTPIVPDIDYAPPWLQAYLDQYGLNPPLQAPGTYPPIGGGGGTVVS